MILTSAGANILLKNSTTELDTQQNNGVSLRVGGTPAPDKDIKIISTMIEGGAAAIAWSTPMPKLFGCYDENADPVEITVP